MYDNSNGGRIMSIDKLAQKAIDAYAHDPEGLTREECDALTETEGQAGTLCHALGRADRGEKTQEKRARLTAAGFSDEFVEGIAGEDGMRAISMRAKWLGDHVARKFGRCNYRETTRRGFINELQYMGAAGQPALSALKALANGVGGLSTKAALAMINIYDGYIEMKVRETRDSNSDVRAAAVKELAEIAIGLPDFFKYHIRFNFLMSDIVGRLTFKLEYDESSDVREAAAVALQKIQG
jgi:hypothetical protein